MTTKTKNKKLSDEENLKMAYELKKLVSDWVDKFNFIQIDVLEAVAEKEGTMVMEHIRQEPLDPSGYVYDLSVKEREQLFEEYQEDTGDNTNLAEGLHRDFLDWVEENKASELEERRDENQGENYPMWNTCFEFKEDPGETVLEAAQAQGLGIIEDLADFNPILFMTSCGHSFYGSYWIPLFLSLPWNKELRKKYEGVKYDMM